MSSKNKVDYAKRGWNFILIGVSLYIISWVLSYIWSNLETVDLVFIALFIASFSISTYFFFKAVINQKNSYLALIISLFLLIYAIFFGLYGFFYT